MTSKRPVQRLRASFCNVAFLVLFLFLAACSVDPGGLDSLPGSDGGSADSTALSASVSQGVAPYALVDLESATVRFLAEAPDLTADSLRDGQVLFRRVGSGREQVLVAVFELTQAQWLRLAGTEPWTELAVGVLADTAHDPHRPAYNLDHATVTQALAGFALADGMRLDLPTEAEWRRASGADQGWWWGTDLPTTQAVVRETAVSIQGLEVGGGMDTSGPRPVGSTVPNSLGLYDILGNVWELTREGEQVVGGSWFDPADHARIEGGRPINNDTAHALVGARLVLRP